MLDVLPTLSADGYTISMTVLPTVTEFMGYDKPKAFTNGIVPPLPIFRVRQVTASAVVWDGQTLVLGNFSDRLVSMKPDGSDVTKDHSDDKGKQLLVFVTPTMMDPAGNRVHSDEEMPFAQDGVPKQPAR